MNSAQFHLALTHVPVILSSTGLVMLIIPLLRKSSSLIKTANYILLIAGLIVIPAYLTGEGSEDIVERMPGVSESTIEKHEDLAKFAMIAIVVAGLMAFIGLYLLYKKSTSRVLSMVMLLFTIVSCGLLAKTAHLGGQIRHAEIRSGFNVQNNSEAEGGQATDIRKQAEKDDD